eukprot:GHVS01087389.1.p2 GENE.GHVS01087389.1~~GHVS01087389.1.p2  ORF type:complete len:126 (+),score=2.14 GHVS01087389.1:2-379(+)
MCACVYVRMCVCAHVCMCICVYACMYARVCAHMCMCTCVDAHLHRWIFDQPLRQVLPNNCLLRSRVDYSGGHPHGHSHWQVYAPEACFSQGSPLKWNSVIYTMCDIYHVCYIPCVIYTMCDIYHV